MEALNKIFTEEQVKEISDKILKSTLGKITDEITGKFYFELAGYLDEHYQNLKDTIEKELIGELADSFIQSPDNYKYRKIREKIFTENKEEILKSLTEEAITTNIDHTLRWHTSNAYTFNWQWKDAILKSVLNNWDLFKDDERINSGLLREVDNLKSVIKNLQVQLNALKTFEE